MVLNLSLLTHPTAAQLLQLLLEGGAGLASALLDPDELVLQVLYLNPKNTPGQPPPPQWMFNKGKAVSQVQSLGPGAMTGTS